MSLKSNHYAKHLIIKPPNLNSIFQKAPPLINSYLF